MHGKIRQKNRQGEKNAMKWTERKKESKQTLKENLNEEK